MDILYLFGINLRNLRLKKGYTQEKLADLADYHRTYIGYLERGERNVSLRTLYKLASALECEIEDLLNGISTDK